MILLFETLWDNIICKTIQTTSSKGTRRIQPLRGLTPYDPILLLLQDNFILQPT